MSEAFDIYTLIFLGLAVFVLVRLRSVLGTRTGHERPPQDPYAQRETSAPANANENVITLPKDVRVRDNVAETPSAQQRSWNNAVAEGSEASKGLQAIAQADSSFDITSFLKNASSAYEMIVSAFGAGDRTALRDLLASDVYEGFSAVIAEREAKGQHIETDFVSIKPKSVPHASLNGKIASVTVEFISDMVSVTRTKDGEIVEGSSEKVVEIKDIWTFSRDLNASSPIWKLVSTESEN